MKGGGSYKPVAVLNKMYGFSYFRILTFVDKRLSRAFSVSALETGYLF